MDTQPDESDSGDSEQQHAKPLIRNAPVGPGNAPNGETTQQPTGNKGNCGTKNDNGGIPRMWEIRIGVFLAVVNLGTLFVLIYQSNEMRKATRAATESNRMTRENAHLDQRAWVGFDSIECAPVAGQEFVIKVTVRNSGKTFATRYRSFVKGEPVAKGADPHHDLEENPLEGSRDEGGIIPPNGTNIGFMIPENHGTLAKETVDAFKSGDILYLLHGRLEYSDIFGCEHWTTFCLRLNPSLKSFDAYGTHNQADNNTCD